MNTELRAGLGLGRVPFIVLGILLAVFLLLPMLVVIPTSWTSGALIEFPPVGFSTQWYEGIFDDPTWTDPFKTSIGIALRTSILATILGTAAALGMRRLTANRSKRFMRSAFILPLAIPYISYALGIYNVFDKFAVEMLDTTTPLIISHAVITFPLVYIVVAGALSGMDPRLGRAAATLGARWPTIVWKIELPLIRTAILGGWLLAFVTSFDEAVMAIFLSPVDQTTLAQQLYRSASESIEPTLSAVSVLITMAACIVLGLATLLFRAAPSRTRPAAEEPAA